MQFKRSHCVWAISSNNLWANNLQASSTRGIYIDTSTTQKDEGTNSLEWACGLAHMMIYDEFQDVHGLNIIMNKSGTCLGPNSLLHFMESSTASFFTYLTGPALTYPLASLLKYSTWVMLNFTVLGHLATHLGIFTSQSLLLSNWRPMFSQNVDLLHIQPSRSAAPFLRLKKCCRSVSTFNLQGLLLLSCWRWRLGPILPLLMSTTTCTHFQCAASPQCRFFHSEKTRRRRRWWWWWWKHQGKKKKMQRCCSYQLLLITYLFQIWRWRTVSSLLLLLILLLLHMSICTDFRFCFSLSPVHIFLLLRTKQKILRKWWWRRKTDGKRRRREKRKNTSKMLLLPMQTRSVLFSLDEMLFCFQVIPRDAADEA